MKHVVYRPCQRQLKPVRHRGDLLDDLEGSILFGREFCHLMGEFQILPL